MKKNEILAFIVIVFALAACSSIQKKGSESVPGATPVISEQIFVDSVWAANRVGFALQTVGNKQFVAYYDKNRMMTVASRELSSNTWQKITLPNKLHWDSHNSVTMSIDEMGYIHVSGNMHVNPLVYFRSEKPYDVNSIVEINKMVGSDEESVTYPKFFYNNENQLLFSYRSGTCGNGNILVNRFLPEQGIWERYLKQPLFEGVEANDNRAAYHKFIKDSKGNFHFIWIWRWTPMVETSHQICYATTPDLIHWKNASGQKVSLPFRPDNDSLIVDGTPSQGGMHNGRFQIILTPDERPIVGYVKYDENGKTQLYIAEFKNGVWLSNKISDWDFRWQFIEGGDQMTIGGTFNFVGFSDDGLLGIDWKTETGQSGRYIVDTETLTTVEREVFFQAKYPEKWDEKLTDNPKMHINSTFDIGKSNVEGEKFVLKWETMNASHGKHAPKIIPDGPLSELVILKIN